MQRKTPFSSKMQRNGRQRCIVSNCVVYAMLMHDFELFRSRAFFMPRERLYRSRITKVADPRNHNSSEDRQVFGTFLCCITKNTGSHTTSGYDS